MKKDVVSMERLLQLTPLPYKAHKWTTRVIIPESEEMSLATQALESSEQFNRERTTSPSSSIPELFLGKRKSSNQECPNFMHFSTIPAELHPKDKPSLNLSKRRFDSSPIFMPLSTSPKNRPTPRFPRSSAEELPDLKSFVKLVHDKYAKMSNNDMHLNCMQYLHNKRIQEKEFVAQNKHLCNYFDERIQRLANMLNPKV